MREQSESSTWLSIRTFLYPQWLGLMSARSGIMLKRLCAWMSLWIILTFCGSCWTVFSLKIARTRPDSRISSLSLHFSYKADFISCLSSYDHVNLCSFTQGSLSFFKWSLLCSTKTDWGNRGNGETGQWITQQNAWAWQHRWWRWFR